MGTKVADSKDIKTQYAALCYRVVDGKLQVLLITSRGTGRWIIPKGWPIEGRTPSHSAAYEAWEEAGVKGRNKSTCLGVYRYLKIIEDGPDVPCEVLVFPLKVKALAPSFPEKGQRRRKWFSPKKAAQKVDEPELAQILREFDPDKL